MAKKLKGKNDVYFLDSRADALQEVVEYDNNYVGALKAAAEALNKSIDRNRIATDLTSDRINELTDELESETTLLNKLGMESDVITHKLNAINSLLYGEEETAVREEEK